MRGWIRIGAAAAVAALIALAANGSAPAQQFPGLFTVTTTADGNDGECARDCTLREAVSLATPDTTTSISLPTGVYRLTLGPLVIQNSVLIIGPGLVGGQGAGARTTVIDARNSSRVVEAPAGTSAIIAGVTLTGGTAATGGAATVGAGGILQFFNSIIEGNTATSRGGAIQALGTITLQNTLVAGNRVTAGSGGAIAVEAGGSATVISSTLSGNSATANGGGIVSAGDVTMTNTTIAGNTAQGGGGFFQEAGATYNIWNTIINGAGSGGACGGAIGGGGLVSHNLSDDATCLYASPDEGTPDADARLGALKNNGGPTDTRALGAGSPAINGGDPNLCISATDQRLATSVGVCDVGAFEFGGKPPVVDLPPPIPGETVNVNRASGIVKIKVPGSDEFFDLRDAQQVPVGSTFDTTKGRVNLVAAADKTGTRTQRAWFYEGLFKLAQTKGSKPLSTLKLTGKLSCGRSSSASAAAKKKKKRHLWGDGKGKFRTQGSFSSATVRGTRWLTEDRCNGTLTKVKRGTVAVRDFRKKRTVIVRAGRQYLARK